jgi:hypothetical protein
MYKYLNGSADRPFSGNPRVHLVVPKGDTSGAAEANANLQHKRSTIRWAWAVSVLIHEHFLLGN